MVDRFLVIDIETKGLSARPDRFVFGCVYADNGNFKKVFHDRKKMVDYLLSQTEYKYIFAHNAEFDLTILFDNIVLHLDNAAIFIGSLFIKAERLGKIFLNSLAVLKSSVKALGECSGNYKGNLDDKFKRWKEGDGDINVTKEDIDYCFKDCEIVFDYLSIIYEMTGKIKMTVAGCAMHIFTRQYMSEKFLYNPLNDIFRESYYGGRVECFRFGMSKNIFKYDINSLYPYVCTKMFFPDFSKVKRGKPCNVKIFIGNYLKTYEGCALIKVNHEKSFVGVLPFRNETEIIYPCGKFEGWYNFNEIRKALSTGLIQIEDVKDYYFAPRMEFKSLREYMLDFFKKKNESVGAEMLLNKFLLNGLTGKFGQKNHPKSIYFLDISEAFKHIKENNIRKQNYEIKHFSEERQDVFLEIADNEDRKRAKWNIPTVSSYICSEARCTMIDYYIKYKNNLIYTDTDSLILDCPIEEKTGTNLGQMKREKDESVIIFGNKHYSSFYKGKKTDYIKGIKKDYKIKNGKYCFFKMIRTKEALRRRELKSGTFIEIKKVLKKNYTKRICTKKTTQTIFLK